MAWFSTTGLSHCQWPGQGLFGPPAEDDGVRAMDGPGIPRGKHESRKI